jgi:hypothetical protein
VLSRPRNGSCRLSRSGFPVSLPIVRNYLARQLAISAAIQAVAVVAIGVLPMAAEAQAVGAGPSVSLSSDNPAQPSVRVSVRAPDAEQQPITAFPFGDPQSLAVGVPVRVQDALAPPPGWVFLQTADTLTAVNRRGTSSPLSETLKVGVAQGFAVNLGVTKNVGTANSGTAVSPSFQYVFFNNNRFDSPLPILSVEGNYVPPQGSGFRGGTYGFGLEATKAIGTTNTAPRVHFNLDWTKINDDRGIARSSTLSYAVGASWLLSDRASFVTDVTYGQTPAHHDDQFFGDAGVTYLLSKNLAVSAGLGVGKDRSDLAGRAFFAIIVAFDTQG